MEKKIFFLIKNNRFWWLIFFKFWILDIKIRLIIMIMTVVYFDNEVKDNNNEQYINMMVGEVFLNIEVSIVKDWFANMVNLWGNLYYFIFILLIRVGFKTTPFFRIVKFRKAKKFNTFRKYEIDMFTNPLPYERFVICDKPVVSENPNRDFIIADPKIDAILTKTPISRSKTNETHFSELDWDIQISSDLVPHRSCNHSQRFSLPRISNSVGICPCLSFQSPFHPWWPKIHGFWTSQWAFCGLRYMHLWRRVFHCQLEWFQ